MKRHRHSHPFLGLALLACAAAAANAPALAQTKNTSGAPTADPSAVAMQLSGTWHLNRDLSTGVPQPAASAEDPATAAPAGSGGSHFGGNRGGGGGGGFGGSGGSGRGGSGRGGGGSREFSESEETRQVHAITDELTDTPATLVIKATAATIEITADDHDARDYEIRGLKEKIDLILAKVDVTSSWANGALVQLFEAGNALKLSESFAASADGKQLTVTLTATRPKNQGGVEKPVTRVYDRATAQ